MIRNTVYAMLLACGISGTAVADEPQDDRFLADVVRVLEVGAANASTQRDVRVNGTRLDTRTLALLGVIELRFGIEVPDGSYWYDPTSGSFGAWGGPTAKFLPPGLSLGGTLDPRCSGGGTDVFLNGRELHPLDLEALTTIAPIERGERYWLDASGRGGIEGQPSTFHLLGHSTDDPTARRADREEARRAG